MRDKRSLALFRFDHVYRDRYRLLAGVDEAGRGPLAGPVVSAALILPDRCRLPGLADSKVLSPAQRAALYRLIQRCAVTVGIGIVPHDQIDQINILQATYASMRQALSRLMITPAHVLVDGRPIPRGPVSQTGVIDGDARSACIAAASIVAKVTRDHLMEAWDKQFPGYGFRRHKGYGTPEHLQVLRRVGPCAIHRRSFAPVRESLAAARS